MKPLISSKNLIAYISIFSILVISTGCSKKIRFALPEQYVDTANIVGIDQVRDWGETHSTYFQNDFIKSEQQLRKSYPELYNEPDSNIDVLALSGGGSKGAYGIGLLKGWHDSGKIPTFRLVTGISTGALIAPFAFLGGEYLDIPAEFYTNVSDEDIYKKKSLTNIIYSDSLASSLPLQTLIRENINEELIKKVAEEHKKGRRLFIGTTNLDAKRLVIWNMGHIAEIGDERGALGRLTWRCCGERPEGEPGEQAYGYLHAPLPSWRRAEPTAPTRRAASPTYSSRPASAAFPVHSAALAMSV